MWNWSTNSIPPAALILISDSEDIFEKPEILPSLAKANYKIIRVFNNVRRATRYNCESIAAFTALLKGRFVSLADFLFSFKCIQEVFLIFLNNVLGSKDVMEIENFSIDNAWFCTN